MGLLDEWKFCSDHSTERCFIKTGTSEGSSKGKSFYVCGVRGCHFRDTITDPPEMCPAHKDFMIELRQLMRRDDHMQIAFRCKCPEKPGLNWCGFRPLEQPEVLEESVVESVGDEEEEDQVEQESTKESSFEEALMEEVQPSPIQKSSTLAKTSARVSDSESDDEFEQFLHRQKAQLQPPSSKRSTMSSTPSVIEDSFVTAADQQEDEEDPTDPQSTPPQRQSTERRTFATAADRSRSDLVRKTLPVRLGSGSGVAPPPLDFAHLAEIYRSSPKPLIQRQMDFASESFSSPRPKIVADSVPSDDEIENSADEEDEVNNISSDKDTVDVKTTRVKTEVLPTGSKSSDSASSKSNDSVFVVSDDDDDTEDVKPNTAEAKPLVKLPDSPKTISELDAKIFHLESQLKISRTMHATGVAASLPDGGKKLREARDRFSDELMELEEKRRAILASIGQSLKEHNDVYSPPQFSLKSPKKEKAHSVLLPSAVRVTDAERLFGGRMNDARWREARAVTAEAIERLHGSLQSCPPEEQETADPRGLTIPLMPHQRKALTWLIWREGQHPCGGILADEMGLGKTLTMISLVLKQKQNEQKFTFSKLDRDVVVANSTLLICPASLMGQWENEIKNRLEFGRLKVLLFHGPKRTTDPRMLARHDVVITTYKTVASELAAEITDMEEETDENDVKMFPKTKAKKSAKKGAGYDSDDDDGGALFSKKRIPKAWSSGKSVLIRVAWQRVILDEGHNIKNHTAVQSQACCRIIAGARWVVTGTPIHNKLLELFSLLKFLRCSPFDELPVWKNWIEPATKNDKADKRLTTLVNCILIRRTKAQIDPATGRAIVDLPQKTSEVIILTLSAVEKRIYDKMFQHSKKVVANFIKKQEDKDNEMVMVSTGAASREQLGYRGGPNPFRKNSAAENGSRTNQVDILVMLLRLRQACAHLHLMESSVNMEQLKNEGEIDLNLEQQFEDLNLGDAEEERRKDPSVEELFRAEYRSTKVSAVLDRLKEVQRLSGDGPREKCIIVSQWVSFLNVVEVHLKRIGGIRYTSITGQVPICERTEIVEKFNQPGGPTIMLLSLTAGGTGLNLIGANHLILVDLHWNPALELQASDRIHRMGQKRDVVIHKFVCKDTIEERILELQTNKLKLANNILSGSGAKGLNKLSLSDLKMLFEIGAEGKNGAGGSVMRPHQQKM